MRVGVAEAIPEELLRGMPAGVEIVRVPAEPAGALDVDFWVLPFSRKQAEAAYPHLRGLKVMQSAMAGVERILPWKPKGVVLCDGRGIHDISASEWVLSVLLAWVKRLPEYVLAQKAGEWRGQKNWMGTALPGAPQYVVQADDLHGKRILIVGYGAIGEAIERRLAGFEVEVVRLARRARPEAGVLGISSLEEELPRADVVVIMVPLTDATRGMIGAREIGLMKRGALLVNAARGPIVQTDALLDALVEGRIHAAVDVTDPEPLPSGHPLWSAPNILITPHIGGGTPEFIRRAFKFVREQVGRAMRGEELMNIVGEDGY